MCSLVRNEFRVCNFGLHHEQPELFTKPQWNCPRPLFLVYRLVIASYAAFALISVVIESEKNFVQQQNKGSNITEWRLYHSVCYLTIWTYTLLTAHFINALIVALLLYKKYFSTGSEATPIGTTASNGHVSSAYDLNQVSTSDNANGVTRNGVSKIKGNNSQISVGLPVDVSRVGKSSGVLPWYSKLSWVLVNIVSVFAIIVTTVFFAILYHSKGGIALNDLNVHALNTVFILVDNFICARPVQLLHCIYPVVYGLTYVVFSAIYWAVDHDNVIYPVVLDWNNVGVTVGFFFIISVVVLLIHGVTFGLYRLRIYICGKVCQPKTSHDTSVSCTDFTQSA